MTDREHIEAAAINLLTASDEVTEHDDDQAHTAFNQACVQMVEALRYAKSIDWWKQFDR